MANVLASITTKISDVDSHLGEAQSSLAGVGIIRADGLTLTEAFLLMQDVIRANNSLDRLRRRLYDAAHNVAERHIG